MLNRGEKKIVVLTNLYPTSDRPYYGTFVKNCVDELRRLDWSVTVLAKPSYGEGVVGYLKFYLQSFLKLIRFRGIVYIHYVSHSSPPALLARVFNRHLKIVLHYHGSDAFPEEWEGSFRQASKRLICQASNKVSSLVIVASRNFKGRISEEYSIAEYKIHVSPSGGVDSAIFYPPNEKPSVQSGRKTLLFAGRMIKGKGGVFAAECIKDLLDEGFSLCGVFVGGGPECSDMKEILGGYLSSDYVHFYPPLSQDKLAQIMRDSDIFLFPSNRKGESLGLTLVESILCGSIPVVFCNGAVEEILGTCSNRLVSADRSEFMLKLKALLHLNERDSQLLSNQLMSAASAFEKEIVSKNLNSILR